VKAKEHAAYRLASIFHQLSLFDEIIDLTKMILPMYIDLPKSKTAKIIRTLFDQCLKFPGRNRNDPLSIYLNTSLSGATRSQDPF